MKKVVSICGSDLDDSELSNYALEVAEQVGGLIAKKGGVLLCGGHGGVMRAACRGAKEENGITVGIMPFTKEEANEFIDISIQTTKGYVINNIVANAGDIVIAIGGRWGTLNEISYRMICEKPLILIRGTGGCVDDIISGRLMQDVESHYFVVNSAEEAVEKAFEFL